MKCFLNLNVFSFCIKDLLYYPERRTGFLFHALNYAQKRKATKPIHDMIDMEEKFTDEEKEEVFKFFKRCVMPKDIKEVENKMRETKGLRRDWILNDFTKYQQCWEFYFSAPELVIFFLSFFLHILIMFQFQVLLDFKLMFEDINEFGLINCWPKIKNVPFEKYGVRIDKSKYPVTRKDEDIFKVLTYINLIPSPRYSFDKAVNQFLVYTEVNISLNYQEDTCIYISCIL